MEDQCVIARQVVVAAGVFAPGHLGELTQIVPFEMVDAALAATASTRRRVRLLPARVIVYLLLAGCLFAELGYRQVWLRLVAGLDGLPLPDPTEACPMVDTDAGPSLPQVGTACTRAACTPCGSSTIISYLDSAGSSKAGYCVCADQKWTCASPTEWPR